MKKVIVSILAIAFAVTLPAQKKKNDSGSGGSENWSASQFTMLENFTKSDEVYYAFLDDNGNVKQPVTKKTMAEWLGDVQKNDKGQIVNCKLRFAMRMPQNDIYPLYYKNKSNATERSYIINNYCFHTKNVLIQTADDVDKLLNSSAVYEVSALSKSDFKDLDIEKIKTMFKKYLAEAGAEATKAGVTAATLPTGNTFSCKGVSLTAEGEQICEYLDTKDAKTRKVYALIKGDSVIYTVMRFNDDYSVDAMKRWAIHIGIINASSPYFNVFNWMNGTQKIYKITLPVISGHKYIYWEMLCGSNNKPQLVSSTTSHDMSFGDEANAKAFYEKLKAARATVKTPEANSSTAAPAGNKTLSGNIRIINKSSSDIWVKVEGSGAMHHITPNQSYSFACTGSLDGKKVWLTDKDQKVLQTLFNVNDDMCKKGEYIWGK